MPLVPMGGGEYARVRFSNYSRFVYLSNVRLQCNGTVEKIHVMYICDLRLDAVLYMCITFKVKLILKMHWSIANVEKERVCQYFVNVVIKLK